MTNKDELEAAIEEKWTAVLYAEDGKYPLGTDDEYTHGALTFETIEALRSAATAHLSLLDDIQALIEAREEAVDGPWALGGREGDGVGCSGHIYCDNEFGSAVALAFGDTDFSYSVFPKAKLLANAHFITTAANIIAKWKEKV